MKWILIAVVTLLLLGPLRRRFLLPLLGARWRTVIALAAGAIAGHLAVTRLMPGAPAWMKIAGPVMAALMIGGAVRELLATVFPERRERNAR